MPTTRPPLFSRDSDVSVVLTSCGRFDLLRQTLESFFHYNTFPLRDFFLIEDSKKAGVENCIPAFVRESVKVMINRPPLGQVASIDKAYAAVKTKYIFHCEDDWLFYRYGFIEDSKKVLEAEPRVLMVYLWSYYHELKYGGNLPRPLLISDRRVANGAAYVRMENDLSHVWCFSFNPGLRRRSEWPAGGYAALVKEGREGGIVEPALNEKYSLQGYLSAVLENDAVTHISRNRHILEPPARWRRRKRRVLRFFLATALFALGYWIGTGA